jgi:hypothetical protein
VESAALNAFRTPDGRSVIWTNPTSAKAGVYVALRNVDRTAAESSAGIGVAMVGRRALSQAVTQGATAHVPENTAFKRIRILGPGVSVSAADREQHPDGRAFVAFDVHEADTAALVVAHLPSGGTTWVTVRGALEQRNGRPTIQAGIVGEGLYALARLEQ